MPLKILVLGAGATGGYFGGRLAEAGADVTFLVRPRRAAELAQNGLVVQSPHGDIRMPVKSVLRDDLTATYDLILVTCKAYDLADAIATIRPAVSANAYVMPILNGVRHLDDLDGAFGAARVLPGTCQIAATLVSDGAIRQLGGFHTLTYGGRDPADRGQRAIADRLHAVASKAKFDAKLSGDIMQELWNKFVMLTTAAALTCLFRGAFGDIVAARDGRAIIAETLEECARAAATADRRPSPAFLDGIRDWIATPGSAFTSSMLRDIERGGPIEADHIVGDMLKRAEAAKLPAPWLRAAYAHLEAYEARRRREGGTPAAAYS